MPWRYPTGKPFRIRAPSLSRTWRARRLPAWRHAASERPDEVDTVLDHLLASATEKAFLAEQFPPVPGAEYATPDNIAGWFEDLRKAIAKEIRARGITPAEWLNGLGAPWNQIGKVFFHLAENRG